MSTSDTIGYWFGVFTLCLCLLVAGVYFTQASQDLEHIEWQVQQVKQMRKEAQLQVEPPLKPKTRKLTEP